MSNKKLKIIKYFLSILIITTCMMLLIVISNYLNYRCFWEKYFNITCAGCGVTRMILSILKLDYYQAFRYNPLFFIFVILFLIYMIYVLICILFDKKIFIPDYKIAIVFVIIILIYMVLRNISYFSYLKPTIIKR